MRLRFAERQRFLLANVYFLTLALIECTFIAGHFLNGVDHVFGLFSTNPVLKLRTFCILGTAVVGMMVTYWQYVRHGRSSAHFLCLCHIMLTSISLAVIRVLFLPHTGELERDIFVICELSLSFLAFPLLFQPTRRQLLLVTSVVPLHVICELSLGTPMDLMLSVLVAGAAGRGMHFVYSEMVTKSFDSEMRKMLLKAQQRRSARILTEITPLLNEIQHRFYRIDIASIKEYLEFLHQNTSSSTNTKINTYLVSAEQSAQELEVIRDEFIASGVSKPA